MRAAGVARGPVPTSIRPPRPSPTWSPALHAPAVDPAPPLADGLRDASLRALALGRSVAGTTAPNPAVGCVLLRDGAVVGEGATAPAGGPHAEVVALRAAGDRAVGATAVTTLEPCAHTGRTGPCTAALVDAGVAAVRYLVPDPNPVAAGGGAVLRAAGVDAGPLDAPDLAAWAVEDLRGFLTLVATGRPHVLLKLAQDRDGGTVPSPGGYLTGTAARRRVHALRAEVDAVLVGGATVRADDPRLDVRDVPHDAGRQPRPVVLTAGADLPPTARLLGRRPLVVVGPGAEPARCAALVAAGAEVVRVDGGPEGPDPAAALAALPAHGVLTVLAEPGPRLAARLLAADLVDVAELHVAGGTPRTAALPLPGPRLVAADDVAVGPDRVLRFVRPGVA